MTWRKDRVLHKRIGRLLVERGIISDAQLKEALAIQQQKLKAGEGKKLLGEILVECSFATEEAVINSVTTQYGIPYLPIENYAIEQELIDLVPAKLVHKHTILPIDKMGNVLTIAVSDIPEIEAVDELEEILSCSIEVFACGPTALRRTIVKYYGEAQG